MNRRSNQQHVPTLWSALTLHIPSSPTQTIRTFARLFVLVARLKTNGPVRPQPTNSDGAAGFVYRVLQVAREVDWYFGVSHHGTWEKELTIRSRRGGKPWARYNTSRPERRRSYLTAYSTEAATYYFSLSFKRSQWAPGLPWESAIGRQWEEVVPDPDVPQGMAVYIGWWTGEDGQPAS
jgi:hypothetical protein